MESEMLFKVQIATEGNTPFIFIIIRLEFKLCNVSCIKYFSNKILSATS